MAPLIDTTRLVTVKTFASTYKEGGPVNRSYIYKLISEGKLETVVIDGAVFVVLPSGPGTSGTGAA
jgi:hypothetical protein